MRNQREFKIINCKEMVGTCWKFLLRHNLCGFHDQFMTGGFSSVGYIPVGWLSGCYKEAFLSYPDSFDVDIADQFGIDYIVRCVSKRESYMTLCKFSRPNIIHKRIQNLNISEFTLSTTLYPMILNSYGNVYDGNKRFARDWNENRQVFYFYKPLSLPLNEISFLYETLDINYAKFGN